MKLGSRLRQLRKERRYTLMDLSELSGLSVSFLSEIERSQTNPSLETLEKLASCYQMTLKQLIDDFDTEDAQKQVIYPPGYKDFLEEIASNNPDENILDLMLKVEKRAIRRAETKEDWKRFYYSLKSILGR